MFKTIAISNYSNKYVQLFYNIVLHCEYENISMDYKVPYFIL